MGGNSALQVKNKSMNVYKPLHGASGSIAGNVGNDNKSIVSNVNTLMSLMRQNIEKRSEDSGCDLNESNNESSHSHAGKA